MSRKPIFLLGSMKFQFTGSKLPSKGDVLRVLYYNMREVKLTLHASASLVIDECLIYWKKARIPTQDRSDCIKKCKSLYKKLRGREKSKMRKGDVCRKREKEFQDSLDDLFDIAHENALNMIQIEVDGEFLIAQREKGRVGSILEVNRKLAAVELRKSERIANDVKRKHLSLQESEYENPSSSSGDYESAETEIELSNPGSCHFDTQIETECKLSKRARKEVLTARRLSAALDKCEDELVYPVEMEKEEFNQDAQCAYIPEACPVKADPLSIPCDLPVNDIAQKYEHSCSVKIEKMKFSQETQRAHIPEACPVKAEHWIIPDAIPINDTPHQDEINYPVKIEEEGELFQETQCSDIVNNSSQQDENHPVKIEEEELIQETQSYDIPESCPVKEEYPTIPCDLPMNNSAQQDELNYPVKVEEEELIQEIQSYDIPDSCPSKEKNSTIPCDLPMNNSRQQDELNYSVEIEEEELIQEAQCYDIPESSPVNEEYSPIPCDLPMDNSAQQDELNYPVKIGEELIQEKKCYNIPEYCPVKEKYSTIPCDLPMNNFAQQGEAPQINIDPLKIENNISIQSRKKKTAKMPSKYTPTHTDEKKPYACDLCSSRFAKNCRLVRHIRSHTGERPFGCDTCPARFAGKSDLVRHLRKHTGEKPFRCATCSARFANKGDLVTHFKMHTGEKPFGCDSCPAKFAHKWHLVEHTRTHNGEKPFSCEYCSVAFARKTHLVSHIRIHTGETRFGCDYCSARFARKSSLIRHTRKHTGDKPHGCDSCSARFVVKQDLFRHLRSHNFENPIK